jgi:hypothetical protein
LNGYGGLPVLPRALTVNPIPCGAACWPLKLAAARAVLAADRAPIWTDGAIGWLVDGAAIVGYSRSP